MDEYKVCCRKDCVFEGEPQKLTLSFQKKKANPDGYDYVCKNCKSRDLKKLRERKKKNEVLNIEKIGYLQVFKDNNWVFVSCISMGAIRTALNISESKSVKPGTSLTYYESKFPNLKFRVYKLK